jgi:hypothetical protein
MARVVHVFFEARNTPSGILMLVVRARHVFNDKGIHCHGLVPLASSYRTRTK